jgi:hypothetical protein
VCFGGSRLEVSAGGRTPSSVKLLLPPRQSRGASLGPTTADLGFLQQCGASHTGSPGERLRVWSGLRPVAPDLPLHPPGNEPRDGPGHAS